MTERPPLWRHQREAIAFARDKNAAMLAMDMGCLTGDSLIHVNRGGNGRQWRLDDLVRRYLEAIPEYRNTKGWDSRIPTMIRCVKADGTIGLAPLGGVKVTGIRNVYELVLTPGRTLRLTKKHEIMTPTGKKPLDTLYAGDEVLVAEAGVMPLTDHVASIRECGKEMVYDLNIQDAAHTYIANGIVVGNTGKSRTAIELLNEWDARKILILCPKKVIAVWPKQFRLYDGEHIIVTRGKGTTERVVPKMQQEYDLAVIRKQPVAVVVNYDSAWRPAFAKWIGNIMWDAIVFDESHRLKAAGGKQSMFAMRLVPRSRHRLGLTGTPMPHSPLDIYAQYRALDPSVFGKSNHEFKTRYAVFGGFQNHQFLGIQSDREDELNQKFYSIAFRVTKDVLELPEEMHVTLSCELSPAAKKIYAQMKNNLWASIEASDRYVAGEGPAPEGGLMTAANALTKVLRLGQLTGGNVKTDEGETIHVDDSKADLLADVLEDLAVDEPVVVFCRFRLDLDAVATVAARMGRGCAEVSGRRDQLAAWQRHGGALCVIDHKKIEGKCRLCAGRNVTPSILAVQIDSGGEGIDLTRARYGVYYSVGFSLGKYNQSVSRLHRPGADVTRPVHFTHLIAEGTVDEDIYAALEAKEEIVERILRSARQEMGEGADNDKMEGNRVEATESNASVVS